MAYIDWDERIAKEAEARGWRDCEHCENRTGCFDKGPCEDWELDEDSHSDIYQDLKDADDEEATYASMRGHDI